jgi:excisionase family DNA binding protein
MQNWINHRWANFFFPEKQTKIIHYLDRIWYVNLTDVAGESREDHSPELRSQNHCVGIKDAEREQVKREFEGYYAPVSRDRIFRQLNAPTQAIVQMLCEGMKLSEVAVNLNISERHLRRKTDKAVEDGEAVTQSLVLQSVQACADDDNVLAWPEQGIDIQACAAQSDNKLAAMVESFETAITAAQLAAILQCSRREIYKLIDEKRIPALKVGTMIRLDPFQVAEWIRSKMTIAA